MSEHHSDDEHHEEPDQFKVGEKKTIDQYTKLDAEDESLQKYKASLLGMGAESISDPNDPRHCVVLEVGLEAPGRDTFTIDLSSPTALANFSKTPFKIKAGSSIVMIVKFRVQHEIISGLRYEQTAKRDGGNILLKLFKPPPIKEMMGSYAPSTKQKPFYEVKLPPMEAPDMKAAKAKYKAQSRFVDDDGEVHMKFDWMFEIADNW